MVTGCGTENDGGSAPNNSDGPPQVEPRSAYVVASMVVDGQARQPVARTRIILDFTDGTVTAKAGCNALFGRYTFDENGLEIARLGGTEMGCVQDRMQQDEMLGQLLPGHWEVTGTDPTTLSRDGAELTLSQEIVRQTELQGTTWMLDSLIEGATVESVPGKVVATIKLTQDGNLEFNDGCNSGGGSAQVTADTLLLGGLRTTLKGCLDADLARISKAYSRVLDGTVDYTLEGNRLTLTDGGSGLGFTVK
ncbi:hypothetical protein ASH02_04290 [Nocardioides sp. Soil796]|nr:hypothetical protein ASH02_04290 [Nocardioides sp. Soil796]